MCCLFGGCTNVDARRSSVTSQEAIDNKNKPSRLKRIWDKIVRVANCLTSPDCLYGFGWAGLIAAACSCISILTVGPVALGAIGVGLLFFGLGYLSQAIRNYCSNKQNQTAFSNSESTPLLSQQSPPEVYGTNES